MEFQNPRILKDKLKLIYFSTNYVYPGVKGNYKENDPVMPINKYAISKLGGECAVQMYKNSLILRICMTEKPFVHKQAFDDVEMNFMFHEDLARNLLKLINKKGITIFKNKKINTKNSHGTGCSLSSAITTYFSCGKTLKKSCEMAIKYVNHSLRTQPNLGKGHGPVNHLNSIQIKKDFR